MHQAGCPSKAVDTMSVPVELTVANFTILCGKSEGRDKLARFAQYAARALVGFITAARPVKGSQLYELNEQAGNVMKNLAMARRTHRWCKEFPVIQGILQGLPTIIPKQLTISSISDKALDLLQKVTLATFLVIDHIGWLKQMKILKGGRRAGTGTIQLGLTFFCASNFLGMLLQGKKALDLGDAPDKKTQRRKCFENAMKHAFLVVQTAHLSRSYETHDGLVGILGMVTSAMDVFAQWPTKALPAPKVAPKDADDKETQRQKVIPDAKACAASAAK